MIGRDANQAQSKLGQTRQGQSLAFLLNKRFQALGNEDGTITSDLFFFASIDEVPQSV
jgi:hypothetical protein